jgi:hypothetical protein
MAIRLGTLLPGSIEIGIGVSRARRGFALTSTGKQEAVIVKRVAPDVLASEVFCASLGRAAELPVPEPIIVKDPSSGAMMFGSIFEDYPNLMQAFQLDPANASNEQLLLVARRLAQWTRIDEAISFDEWVGNVDRNLQNLLWDGFDHFLMIDHERCLGHKVPGRQEQNYLLLIALAAIVPDQPAIENLKVRVLDSVLEFEPTFANEAAEALRNVPMSSAASCSQKYFEFVTQRLPQLAGRLVTRFPSSQLSFEV